MLDINLGRGGRRKERGGQGKGGGGRGGRREGKYIENRFGVRESGRPCILKSAFFF